MFRIDENANPNELLSKKVIKFIDWGRAIDMTMMPVKEFVGRGGTANFDCPEMLVKLIFDISLPSALEKTALELPDRFLWFRCHHACDNFWKILQSSNRLLKELYGSIHQEVCGILTHTSISSAF